MSENEPQNGTERRHDPETLRLRNLSPSLTVNDIQASLRFWVDGVGFHLEERWEEDGVLQGVMLVAGSCHLGLSQDDWAKGRDREKGIGFRMWAESSQDLDEIAARLRERGVAMDGPKDEPWGGRSLTVTDPDGFKLTIGAS